MGGRKVAIIGDRDTEKFRGWLIRDMIAAGHSVLVCGPDDAALAAGLTALGAVYRPIGIDGTSLDPLRSLRSVTRLSALLRCERVDVVLTHSTKQNVVGPLAARLAGITDIFAMIEGFGYAFTEGKELKRRLLRLLITTLLHVSLRCCAAVFVLNEADEQFVRAKRLVRPTQPVVRISGTGIDLAHFPLAPVPTGAPVFLLIARLLREKGILDFVEAARLVKREAPQCRFQVLGPLDTHPGALTREEIAAWEAENIVEYLGETDDVRPYLRSCSVFVLPTYYREGLPRTVIEALATGRPVITTGIPACRETTVDGVNGFIVPARDPRSLAEMLRRFIRNPSLATRMGAAGRSIAERTFDVGRVNAVIMATMMLIPL